MIASSVQGAHITASNALVPDAARQIIIDAANAAFVNGMTSAMVIGAVLMFSASALVLAILPSQVQQPDAVAVRQAPLTPERVAGD